jgi:hypothetical protein
VKSTCSSPREEGLGERERNKKYTISMQHQGMEFWAKVVNHLFLFGGHIFNP